MTAAIARHFVPHFFEKKDLTLNLKPKTAP